MCCWITSVTTVRWCVLGILLCLTYTVLCEHNGVLFNEYAWQEESNLLLSTSSEIPDSFLLADKQTECYQLCFSIAAVVVDRSAARG